MNQTQSLLTYLKIRPITPLVALRKLGIYRLSARILELRAHHTIITTLIKKGGKRFAEYRLIK